MLEVVSTRRDQTVGSRETGGVECQAVTDRETVVMPSCLPVQLPAQLQNSSLSLYRAHFREQCTAKPLRRGTSRRCPHFRITVHITPFLPRPLCPLSPLNDILENGPQESQFERHWSAS